ncbi:MAG: DUF6954 family protein [Saccharofermentanales bacterium]
MKRTIGIVLSILVGSFVGFFGVIVSVFADSGISEQLITIGVILLVYFLISAIFGFFVPQISWKWGLFIGAPAIVFLVIFMFTEFNLYFLLYMIFIVGISCLGALSGGSIKNRIRKDDDQGPSQ